MPSLLDLPLFAPRARATDPLTSFQAADRMVEGAKYHRYRILGHLRRIAPATATKDEAGHATGLDDVQAARRLSELKDAGLIEDSGERRPSKSGNSCIAWRAR